MQIKTRRYHFQLKNWQIQNYNELVFFYVRFLGNRHLSIQLADA